MKPVPWKDVRIYYINLDRRPDRRTFIEKQLSQLGLHATRIRAVDAKRLKPSVERDMMKRFVTKAKIPERILGRIGCYLSHLKALRRALKDASGKRRQRRPVLILEDDCASSPAWKTALQAKTLRLPQDPHTDLAYLGGLFWLRGWAKKANPRDRSQLGTMDGPWLNIDQSGLKIACTLAYMIPHDKALRRVYTTLLKNPPTAIDLAYIKYIQPAGHCYIHLPVMCVPNLEFVSDVTTEGKKTSKKPFNNSYQ